MDGELIKHGGLGKMTRLDIREDLADLYYRHAASLNEILFSALRRSGDGRHFSASSILQEVRQIGEGDSFVIQLVVMHDDGTHRVHTVLVDAESYWDFFRAGERFEATIDELVRPLVGPRETSEVDLHGRTCDVQITQPDVGTIWAVRNVPATVAAMRQAIQANPRRFVWSGAVPLAHDSSAN